MKKRFLTIITIILILAVGISLFACSKPNNDTDGIGDNDTINDDDYELQLIGIVAEPIIITKRQIKDLAKEKGVVYTEDNPCYPSDKTDDDGNLIPHTLKGVYLDDILEEYAGDKVSGAYSSITLKATDKFFNILSQNVYSQEHGGTKMIIAYEYDGYILNPNEKSGALRAVFPNQPANYWVQKLDSIEFSDAQLSLPQAENLLFMELLSEEYYSSFSREVAIEDNSIFTYYGISLDALFEANILSATDEDIMYITAWDKTTNIAGDVVYKEYTSWKSYEYFRNAFLVYKQQIDNGPIEPYDRSPLFDGENILKGMTIKNTLSISVSATALVSLEVAFQKFGENNIVELKDVLEYINMNDNEKSYLVTDINNNSIQLDYADLAIASLQKNDNNDYILHYGGDSITIKSINMIN